MSTPPSSNVWWAIGVALLLIFLINLISKGDTTGATFGKIQTKDAPLLHNKSISNSTAL